MLAVPDQYLGGFLGMFPAGLMLASSFIPLCMSINPLVEASIQNTAAGMILGAVGMEFFPVIKDSIDRGELAAVSVGFLVSMAALLGIERLVEALAAVHESTSGGTDVSTEQTPLVSPHTKGWDPEGINYASTALASHDHQKNIKARLREIQQSVDSVISRCKKFLFDGSPMPVSQSEQAFERIDEALHMLDYRIDHAVRLLQGSESNGVNLNANSSLTHLLKPRFGAREEVERICSTLASATAHILEHASDEISSAELVELYSHLEDLRTVAQSLHGHVETASRKWCRSKPFPETCPGDVVSIGLTLPVCIDSVVDGFVIGIATSMSFNAGTIMALVNSMEMSFLAMAYSLRCSVLSLLLHHCCLILWYCIFDRVLNCTGSSAFIRYLSLLSPPVLLVSCAVMGGVLGYHAVENQSALYIGFNTFSAVALLLLACNVLLIEARHTHDEVSYPSWWEPITLVFVGVYFVIISDFVIHQ